MFTFAQANELVQNSMGKKIAMHQSLFRIIKNDKDKEFAIVPKQVVYVYQINELLSNHPDEEVKIIRYRKNHK